jgi:hypothetical protein
MAEGKTDRKVAVLVGPKAGAAAIAARSGSVASKLIRAGAEKGAKEYVNVLNAVLKTKFGVKESLATADSPAVRTLLKWQAGLLTGQNLLTGIAVRRAERRMIRKRDESIDQQLRDMGGSPKDSNQNVFTTGGKVL